MSIAGGSKGYAYWLHLVKGDRVVRAYACVRRVRDKGETMPVYLLLHTDDTPFPELDAEQLSGFKKAWEDKAAEGVGFLETQVGEKGRGYCRFEAPSIEALQQAVQEITGNSWPEHPVAADVRRIVDMAQ